MTMDLEEGRRVEGRWWLPTDPDASHFGVLSYEPAQGLELDLRGRFESEVPLTADAPYRPTVILGLGNEGLGCSLIDTAQVGRVSRMAGEEQRTFWARLLLTGGVHAGADGAIPVRAASVRMRHLEEWADIDPFRWGYDDPNTRDRAVATFERPRSFEWTVGEAKVSIRTALETGSNDCRSLVLGAATWVTWTPSEPADLRDVLQSLHHIRDFISLHAGSTTWIREATFDPVVDGNHRSGGRCNATFYQPICEPRRPVASRSTLIPFELVQAEMGARLSRWFELRAQVGPAVELLIESLSPGATPISTFLNVSRAFEMVHRGLVGGDYLPTKEYEAVRKTMAAAIPANVPDGLRARLKSAIKFGNEASLRTRLKKALQSLEEPHRELLFPDHKSFTGRVVDTRNYLTHLAPELADQALVGADIAIAADRLQMLTWWLLMQHLGYPTGVLLEAVHRDWVWAQRVMYVHGRKESGNAALGAALHSAKANPARPKK